MAIETLVPVEEYLRTAYHPDREYVEGRIVERNVGKRDHSITQREVILQLSPERRKRDFEVFPEQRLQVGPNRFRVPDLCVYRGSGPRQQIFTEPPLVAIEILSEDDRMSEMQERIDDYLRFGAASVWVIDPRTRRAWSYTKEGIEERRDGVFSIGEPTIRLELAPI